MKPNSDELRIVVFGPGFGECILIHIGDNKWVCVDSCRERSANKPFPIWYLESMGLSPRESIILIVATHWHDDHIDGLSEIVRSCPEAKFVCGICFRSEEFFTMISVFNEQENIPGGSGAKAINDIFQYLIDNNKTASFVNENTIVLFKNAEDFSHEGKTQIISLSPSNKQTMSFFVDIATLMPSVLEPKKRCVKTKHNHNSVVLWLEVGAESIILGADLEETTDPATGWQQVIALPVFKNSVSSFFKVAHHGSENGHNQALWDNNFSKNVHVVVAPYNRGRKLPKQTDKERICGLTDNAYCTASDNKSREKREITKFIRGIADSRVYENKQNEGYVEWSQIIGKKRTNWKVTLFGDACHLLDFECSS